MAVAVGQRCVVRIQITDVELRKARDIKATIVSPQGEEKCQNVSFDEVSGVVYASVDVNSVGSWSMWLGVCFDKELFYTPAFVFAEVEGDAKPCDAPYIVDVEVAGESVSVTPPKVDVDAVTREEFDALSKEVSSKVDKVDGKGLSTNDFTDEYKKKVDELGEGGGASITIDTELDETSNNAIANSAVTRGFRGLSERLNEKVEPKADKKGYYKDMSVGMADNLVGRGDEQDAQISFRPSAGVDNITDGAARIERIKGNSVVWNQMFTKINTETQNGVTCVNNGDGSYTVYTDEGGATAMTSFMMSGSSRGVLNHILLISGAPNNNNYYLYDAWSGIMVTENKIYKSASDTSQIYIRVKQGTIISEPVIFYPQFIDLTQMFGTGNEPTTVEEYHQRKPMNIEDEFAYNAGELIDMKVNSLISTSDNAYDYTKGYARVMGGYKYDITANAGATLVVSFYADGEDDNEEREIAPDSEGKYTFPANGICHVNGAASHSDVCVCLKHSYDKPHPAYQQEVKDLSFISEAFPNGMRSAGSAFDEIRFNPTKKVWEKVERVGVRTYAEGDAEDSSVTTDGKTTNYPLDNPTPTTIDLSPNFNPDYLVWDFGTEEAIASVPSAPFRADINYEPNAVDDLRWAVSEIRNLKAQLAQMQTSVTNLNE
jgi:hypothetical protein